MLRHCFSARAKCEVKRGSRSEMMVEGRPNHLYTCSRYRRAMPSPVMVVAQGRNTAALEHLWSTMVRMASYGPFGGSCMIRSMATTSKGIASCGTGILYKGTLVRCVRFLFCWQWAHPRTYSVTHSFRPGHQKNCAVFRMVMSLPVCPAVGASCVHWSILCLTLSTGGTTTLTPFFHCLL